MVRRALNSLSLTLLAAAAVLRVGFGHRAVAGASGATWALRLVLLVLLVRLVLLGRDALKRVVPWTRLAIPALLAVESAYALWWRAATARRSVLWGVLEVALVLWAALSLRGDSAADGTPPECRLSARLARFLPERLASGVAFECLLLWTAARTLLRRAPVPSTAAGVRAFGYVESSIVRWLPLILAVVTPFEAVALWVLLHGRMPLLHAGLLALQVWAVLYSVGLVALMRQRPHGVGLDVCRFRRGPLARCEVEPWNVAAAERVEVEPLAPDPRLKRAASLHVAGAPTVLLTLSKPVEVHSPWRRPRRYEALLVSADDPAGLLAAIAAPARRSGTEPAKARSVAPRST